ncbi:MAG: hypothetical protein WC334_09180 [Kiritimatiellales bacterium]
MTEQKPQRKGRDFLIGFFGSAFAVVGVLIFPLIISDGMGPSMEDFVIGLSYIGGIIFAVVAARASFTRHRKFIGIGILAATVAVPLLLFGSCNLLLSGL